MHREAHTPSVPHSTQASSACQRAPSLNKEHMRSALYKNAVLCRMCACEAYHVCTVPGGELSSPYPHPGLGMHNSSAPHTCLPVHEQSVQLPASAAAYKCSCRQLETACIIAKTPALSKSTSHPYQEVKSLGSNSRICTGCQQRCVQAVQLAACSSKQRLPPQLKPTDMRQMLPLHACCTLQTTGCPLLHGSQQPRMLTAYCSPSL